MIEIVVLRHKARDTRHLVLRNKLSKVPDTELDTLIGDYAKAPHTTEALWDRLASLSRLLRLIYIAVSGH